MRRGADRGLAALPMYDRPELRAETDALWARLREAIRDAGLDAPEALERGRPLRPLWAAPELVLAQTCGLPYVSALAGRVGLLGAPDHALEGCPPGYYRSALIVPEGSPAGTLADLRGARAAINARDSQSGYAALMHAAAPEARDGAFFGPAVLTGSHAASVEAVAAGRADIAAIDAVSWALARRLDAAAARVRVLGWTEPTPALPYITGLRRQVGPLARAVSQAVASLDAGLGDALLLRGLVPHAPADYEVIRTRLAEAHAAHRLPGPAD